MNTASHNPPLVAPRPVRLTSGSPHSFLVRSQPIRLVSAPAEQQERDSNDDAWPESSGASDKERASPGASPRLVHVLILTFHFDNLYHLLMLPLWQV
jgi:hypothetical protein